MYRNYAGSVKKKLRPLTTFSTNAPVSNRHASTYYNQPIINTMNWDSADIIAFSHLSTIDSALTFE